MDIVCYILQNADFILLKEIQNQSIKKYYIWNKEIISKFFVR